MLAEFSSAVQIGEMTEVIKEIERVVECGDNETDRARVRDGLCPELNQLRLKYSQLDEIMARHLQDSLVPILLSAPGHIFTEA